MVAACSANDLRVDSRTKNAGSAEAGRTGDFVCLKIEVWLSCDSRLMQRPTADTRSDQRHSEQTFRGPISGRSNRRHQFARRRWDRAERRISQCTPQFSLHNARETVKLLQLHGKPNTRRACRKCMVWTLDFWQHDL